MRPIELLIHSDVYDVKQCHMLRNGVECLGPAVEIESDVDEVQMQATDCSVDVHTMLNAVVYKGSKDAGRVEREDVA